MAEVVVVDEGRDPDPLGCGGDGREVRDRRHHRDEVIGDDEGRRPEGLGPAGAFAEFGRVVAV